MARQIENAEPHAPTDFGEVGYERSQEQCQQIVEMALQQVRKAKRNGGRKYGKHVVAHIDKRIRLTPEEEAWLTDWINYLHRWPWHLTNDEKYANPAALLSSLRRAAAASPRKEVTDRPNTPAANQIERVRKELVAEPISQALPEFGLTGQTPAEVRQAFSETDHKRPIVPANDIAAIGAVDPASQDYTKRNRAIPGKFIALQSTTARAFFGEYYRSNDIEKIVAKARAFAADTAAVSEFYSSHEQAKSFFIETMQKLGIPLS